MRFLTSRRRHFKVPREKLQPDDDFFKTLGIDSLQTLDLLTKLENHFHVELPDYELQGVCGLPHAGTEGFRQDSSGYPPRKTGARRKKRTWKSLPCRDRRLPFHQTGNELINMVFSVSPCLCGEISL